MSTDPIPDPETQLPSNPSPEPTQPLKPVSKICQNEKCKAENPANNIYCWKCGTALPETEAEKPVCKDTKCGYINPKGSKHCCMCGKSLSNSKSFTKQDAWDFFWDIIIYSLYIQLMVTYQTWVISNYTSWSFDGFLVCIGFSIMPAFGNLYKKKRGVKLEQSQQDVSEYNDEVREERFKQREQLLKEKEKNIEFQERIKKLESGDK